MKMQSKKIYELLGMERHYGLEVHFDKCNGKITRRCADVSTTQKKVPKHFKRLALKQKVNYLSA